jgi:hypothetical protein
MIAVSENALAEIALAEIALPEGTSPEETAPGASVADSPAILRLRLLEMKFAVAGPLSETARKTAFDLIGALKRSIAEKPSLTFADVVAKLKTCDEMARDGIGDKASELQMTLLKSAIADLRRLPPPLENLF